MSLEKALRRIQNTLPGGSLEAYLAYANSIPMLTETEEYDAARRVQEEADVQAAKTLVLSHLRFVARVARGYLGYGLPVADLIQEGTIGLMKAVRRFDPAQGVRLAAFAVHWIKSEIHEFILKNWRIVRVATTKAQRKLFFKLRGMKTRLGWMHEEDIVGVAETLGVSPQDVRDMEARLSAQDTGLEIEYDGEIVPLALPELEDAQADPAFLLEAQSESQSVRLRLRHALAQLNDRERKILQARWMADKKMTLKEMAETLKISMERVRQIESAALSKLRGALT